MMNNYHNRYFGISLCYSSYDEHKEKICHFISAQIFTLLDVNFMWLIGQSTKMLDFGPILKITWNPNYKIY